MGFNSGLKGLIDVPYTLHVIITVPVFLERKNHSILLYITFGLRNQVGLNNCWLRQPTAMQTVSVSAYLTHLP
jgi:hypothetical protein